ncbi:MAG: patatin-like phospholipase family protein [Nocardioidaceae bacterium]
MRVPLPSLPVPGLRQAPPLLPELAGEAPAQVSPPDIAHDPVLLLHHMERTLVRAHLEAPYAMTPTELRRLRYLIAFARLTRFEPGAARPGGAVPAATPRTEVDLTAELAPWRELVVDKLSGPLRRETSNVRRLARAREVFYALEEQADEQRATLLANHKGEFTATDLDAEIAYKSLALVLGGGGGAGFVYLGAMKRLVAAGITPSYIIGSSIGAVLGSLFARSRPVPIEDYIEFTKSISYRAVLGPEPMRRRHGLTSVMSVRIDEVGRPVFAKADGTQITMDELAIPYDSVVAGVHRGLFSRLPARFRRQEMAMAGLRSLPVVPIGLGPMMVSRLWQAASFFDSRVVKPIVLGGDALTRRLNVVDAAAFSAAIPGVLHHETDDPDMVPILDELMESKQVAALVDGGAASNVPVEQAWIMVQRGRIGTRNVLYLALDCFHPRWDPKHLWLTPLTRAVQLAMVRNAPYADQLIRMNPTLSPATLAPGPEAIEQSVRWGEASMDQGMEFVARMLEPIWWSGDRPPRPRPRKARRTPDIALAPLLAEIKARPRDPVTRLLERYFS